MDVGGSEKCARKGTGSGNLGYAAIWTGASTLTTDSALYVSTTAHAVGIGTNTPDPRIGLTVTSDGTIGQLFLAGRSNQNQILNLGYDTVHGYGFLQATTQGSTWDPLILQPAAANVGIGTTTPQFKLSVTGASGAYNGTPIAEFTTGTGASTDEALTFGVHEGDYAYIQAVKQGTAMRNLLLEPNGGNVGVNVTAPPIATLQVSGTFTVSLSTQVTSPSLYVSNSGRVGVGTSNPAYTLDVQRTDGIYEVGRFMNNTVGGAYAVYQDNTALVGFGVEGGKASIRTSAIPRFTIDSAGNVGIGTTTPQTNLDVSGSIFHSGIITDLSDRRMKQDVHPLSSTLQKVMSLMPVSYEKKMTPDVKEFGFIAQDVMPLFPALVSTGKDPSQTLSLNYVGMISPIVKALQEMEASNDNAFDALRKQNAALVSDTAALKTQLKAANDNYIELRKEVQELKHAGGKR